jgi:hypothetical protein
MKKNGKRSSRGLQLASAGIGNPLLQGSVMRTAATIIFVFVATQFYGAQLTGVALLAEDQKTAAPGVWVVVTYHVGDKVEQVKTISGTDGSYTVAVPDTAASPITVRYYQTGQTIIIDSPPPLSDSELKSNKPLPPVFVQPEGSTLDVQTLAKIFERRGQELSPEEKKLLIIQDAKVLLDSKIEEASVIDKAKTVAIEETQA